MSFSERKIFKELKTRKKNNNEKKKNKNKNKMFHYKKNSQLNKK